MKSYFELLLSIKRLGYIFPLDLRRYVLYNYCGKPKSYFISSGTVHTVCDVRQVKQNLIYGIDHLSLLCPTLKNDLFYKSTAVFLRLKYAVRHAIRENPNCISVTVSINDIFCDEENVTGKAFINLMGSKMGFCITPKENDNLLIEWTPTTKFHNYLLKIDPRYNLLEYKKK